jgi:hypothetical protein
VYATTGHDAALIDGDLAAEHDRSHPTTPQPAIPTTASISFPSPPDHDDDTAADDDGDGSDAPGRCQASSSPAWRSWRAASAVSMARSRSAG